MPLCLSRAEVLWLRVRAQRLETREADPAGAVRVVCGIQAQEPTAAALSVRARSIGLVAADVKRALASERSVVRTWLQRGTLHLVAADDLPWLLPLLGPVFGRGGERRRRQLGLDEEAYGRGIVALRAALVGGGALTRAELAPLVARTGVPTEGQALVHLLARAALDGLVCLGPERGGKPTYVLPDEWLPRRTALPRNAALAELARRYVNAYAPTAPGDLAA